MMADVRMNASPASLPGSAALQQITNGLAGWALIVCLAAVVIGAAAWAAGSHAQNYQHAFSGRRTVLISGAAALVVGAAPTLVNFFFHLGQSVK